MFLTGRRTGTRSSRPAAGNAYLLTGQARLSYRRAAEIFTAATRQLDPAGRGCGNERHLYLRIPPATPEAPPSL